MRKYICGRFVRCSVCKKALAFAPVIDSTRGEITHEIILGADRPNHFTKELICYDCLKTQYIINPREIEVSNQSQRNPTDSKNYEDARQRRRSYVKDIPGLPQSWRGKSILVRKETIGKTKKGKKKRKRESKPKTHKINIEGVEFEVLDQ